MTVLRAHAIHEALTTQKLARETFGDETQDDMCMEECSELTIELLHRRRGRGSDAKVQEEASDVILMVIGLLDEEGWEMLVKKTKRLQRRIEEHRPEQQEGAYRLHPFEVWVLGEMGPLMLGKQLGLDFKTACLRLAKDSPGFQAGFEPEKMTYWGRPLFENRDQVTTASNAPLVEQKTTR